MKNLDLRLTHARVLGRKRLTIGTSSHDHFVIEFFLRARFFIIKRDKPLLLVARTLNAFDAYTEAKVLRQPKMSSIALDILGDVLARRIICNIFWKRIVLVAAL